MTTSSLAASTFSRRSILLTGGVGFLGSVVLEQLLRLFGNDISRCFVLIRGRGKTSGRDRLEKVLNSDLFALAREKHKDALIKVEVIEGDLSLPGLGLSDLDVKRLSEVSVILHCAARIKLHDSIHNLLQDNYIGTRNLLDFAVAHMPHLVAFVHTSSFSAALGSGSMALEKVYPLTLGDTAVDDSQLASSLLSMDPHSADVEGGYLVRRWDLRTPYVLTKRLAELLVQRYHDRGLLPCAIVRPSSIVAIAGDPKPGYMGNFAMFSSLIAGYVNGFYSASAFATSTDYVMDAVPADVAAGVVLGAAVTLGAGIRCKQQLERTAAAVAAMPYSDWGEAKDMTMASSGGGSNGGDLLVFHAATSGVRPLPMICFYYRMHMFFGRHKPQRSWPLPTLNKKSHVYMDPTYVPDPGRIKQAMRATRRKATLSCLLLKLLGREREAKRLGTSFLAWAIINNSNLEEDVTFSVKNVLALETLLLAPYSLSAAAAATADTKVEASGSSGGNDDDDDDDESNPIDTTLLKAQEQQLMLRQPLLPVVWRSDWGPLLDAMMVDVVQRLMGIKLVPPPPPRHK